MSLSDQKILGLREALNRAPHDQAIRHRLATALMKAGRPTEALAEYHAMVLADMHNAAAKLELARCYLCLGKSSAAMVIVEELLKDRDASAGVHGLHSLLLANEGETERAAREYRRALEADADFCDAALAGRLLIDPNTGVDIGALPLDDDDPPADNVQIHFAPPEDLARQAREEEIEHPAICLADVAGMSALKEEVYTKVIFPARQAAQSKVLHPDADGAFLLYGPPGCGETHLARAIAGELKAGLLRVDLAEIIALWPGEPEAYLREVFQIARQARPCVVLFQDVDVLCGPVTPGAAACERWRECFWRAVAALAPADKVVVLGATTAPWRVDAQWRRQGRFVRSLFVPPPDEPARRAVLKGLLHNRPAAGVDFSLLAEACKGYSCADLKAAVDLAVQSRLHQSVLGGVASPITTRDLLAAAKGVEPSAPAWFTAAQEHLLTKGAGDLFGEILGYLRDG